METTHLGKPSALPASPGEAALDYVPNPRAGALYLVRFAAPEFTSLCPVTGQPDFAHLVIDYAPDRQIVESKSLKLFLVLVPQPSRLPRGGHRRHRPAAGRGDEAALAQDRRLLVSARRHPDRRLLADRRAAGGPLGPRPGRRPLSRPGLGLEDRRPRRRLDRLLCRRRLARRRARRRLARARAGRGRARGARPYPQRHRRLARPACARPDPFRDRAGHARRGGHRHPDASRASAPRRRRRRSRRFAREDATVVSIQNGISNAETLRRLLPGSQVVQAMVPYNVVRLGPGRWHRATWGDLTAEDHEVTRDLAARIGDRPGPAAARRRHAVGDRLGQAAVQPQQCDQRAVGPHHPRGAEAARLSPGLRRGDHRDARPARSRRHRARQDRPRSGRASCRT